MGQYSQCSSHMQHLRSVRHFLILLPVIIVSTPVPAATDQQDAIYEQANKPWRGDLDGITERGFLRILTVHNPLFFGFDGVTQEGMVAELAKLYQKHLSEEIGQVRSPKVVVIPVERSLLPALLAGRGDVVMANLTITPERQKLVDFGPVFYPDVDEQVITGPAAESVGSFDDLVTTGLYIRRSSSYFEHLQTLNAERQAKGRKPIPVTEADEVLEDYDLLDMLNAGVIKAVVVDSHKADFWEKIYPRITVHRDLSLHSDNQIAWAIRRDSSRLMASITAFDSTVKKGTLLGNIVIKRYLENTHWMLISAQAYQESRFDQNKRSEAGALGVMQVLPETAASKAVGIPDISVLANNVHAGVKYLQWLRKTYYSDESISPLDRILLSFAAYNAGPGNMKRARHSAKKLGLNPDRWFGNVEIGMYRAVSGQPASYVRNIYKYYVTYQGLEKSREEREQALKSQLR